MRDGIIRQFPATLPRDKVVLVVGPEEDHGLNSVKSLIQQLTRQDDWIRSEFRANVSTSAISEKVGIILAMAGVSTGSLANIKKTAIRFRICCLHQALTVGEVKKCLDHIVSIRDRPNRPDSNGTTNGAAAHAPASAASPTNGAAHASAQSSIEAPKKSPSSLEEALEPTRAAIAQCESILAQARDTLMDLEVKADVNIEGLRCELDNLRVQLEEKDRQITKLNGDLSSSKETARENITRALDATDENKRLKEDNERLQNALDGLENVFRQARPK